MLRTITFQNSEGKYDVPSFLLTENEHLVMAIHLPPRKHGSNYFLNLEHGESKRTISLRDQATVVLDPEWLEQGGDKPLLASLELRNHNGNIVYKRYNIEPLTVTKTAVGTEYFSYVQAVEKKNAELQGEVDKLKLLYEALVLRVESYEQNGIELVFED